MTDSFLSLSDSCPTATESDWLEGVSKALKGKGGVERLTTRTADGIEIKPLYRETDFPSATDPLDTIRGRGTGDAFLPWDIRQSFSHPSPAEANKEILRDLKRGVLILSLPAQ